MGWAVGYVNRRWVGYGVPATCDHPGCGSPIDRGLAYKCEEGIAEVKPGCGLFFCTGHGGGDICERCHYDLPPFDPTPDTAEWLHHQATDPTWAQWRKEQGD